MHWSRTLLWPTIALFLLCVGISCATYIHGESVQARILLQQLKEATPWEILDESAVDSGATVRANTNVIFHLPPDIEPINRETLLGNRGKDVRYWGYCFPIDYDPKTAPQVRGFPGKLFLSEKERAVRAALLQQSRPKISVFNPPTQAQLNQSPNPTGLIQHQKEIFNPGETCYIMTQQPLPIGTDRDNDKLNSALEHQHGTDPNNADTDGDGLSDGVEVFNLHTDPLRRDTDGDGLIDGLEVHLHTSIQPGDTDPLNPDSDGDGLCDGYCRIGRQSRLCSDFAHTNTCVDTVPSQWAGEDKNLNGVLDPGETDPLKWDTDGNGVSDLQEYYNCLLTKKTGC